MWYEVVHTCSSCWRVLFGDVQLCVKHCACWLHPGHTATDVLDALVNCLPQCQMLHNARTRLLPTGGIRLHTLPCTSKSLPCRHTIFSCNADHKVLYLLIRSQCSI